MEGNDAFSIKLRPNPNQTKVVLILADCSAMFKAEDFDEIIQTWRALDAQNKLDQEP